MKKSVILLSSVAVFGTVGFSQADTHDEAKRLSSEKEILPLETVLDKAKQAYPGRVLEVELEREYGGYQYEIEILDEQGRVVELKYDARNGELLKKEFDD